MQSSLDERCLLVAGFPFALKKPWRGIAMETAANATPPDRFGQICHVCIFILPAGMLLLLLGCLLAEGVFRLRYLRGPCGADLTRVVEGMSPEEVRAIAGTPHKRYTDSDGIETWIYFHDALQQNYSGVQFDRDGKVKSSWLH
jgi:hypothetical protein